MEESGLTPNEKVYAESERKLLALEAIIEHMCEMTELIARRDDLSHAEKAGALKILKRWAEVNLADVMTGGIPF